MITDVIRYIPTHITNDKDTREVNFTLEQLQELFHLKQTDAAKELGIGQTALKRICRKYGIDRWPFRQIKAIDTYISKVRHEPYISYISMKSLEETRVKILNNPNKKLQNLLSKSQMNRLSLQQRPTHTISKKNAHSRKIQLLNCSDNISLIKKLTLEDLFNKMITHFNEFDASKVPMRS